MTDRTTVPAGLTRRAFLKTAAIAAAGGMALPRLPGSDRAGSELPNIVFIMADDLGYGDVGAFNPSSRIPTTNLDRLAGQGKIFSDAHSGSAVCTPTRYGLLTGRYCWRTRLKSGVLNGYSRHLIDPERQTVARLLKERGYHTACIGKWHLGMDLPRGEEKKKIDYSGKIKNGPKACGFDYFYGITASLDFPPYVFVENDRFTEAATGHFKGSAFPAYLRAGEIGPSFKHIEVLDSLAARAAAYIEERAEAADKKPFFLYLPLTSPHKPVMPAPRFRGRSKLGPYGDFVLHTDWVVGAIDKALARAGCAKETLLIVTSDNGSYMHRLDAPESPVEARDNADHLVDPKVQAFLSKHHRANGPWRGTKADAWEGGHRVPFIARWPGVIEAGTRCDETICHVDLMATCAAIAKADLAAGAAEDSSSLLPLMQGRSGSWKRPPVVHHSANGTFALRRGKWKLIAGSGSGGRGRPRSKPWSEPYQLYDMHSDPGETENLADRYPEEAARLTRELKKIIAPR